MYGEQYNTDHLLSFMVCKQCMQVVIYLCQILGMWTLKSYGHEVTTDTAANISKSRDQERVYSSQKMEKRFGL